MENYKKLECFWLKTEADRKVNLIIKAEPELLDKEIDVNFIGGKIVIDCENVQYSTGNFPIDIHHSILNNYTTIIFANEDGNPFFSFELPPFIKNKKNNI